MNMQYGGIDNDIEQKRRRTMAGIIKKNPEIPEMVARRHVLTIAILSAENVDEFAGAFNCTHGWYQVCATASHQDPKKEYRTNTVRADPVFPRWHAAAHVVYKGKPFGEYLLLEVVQHLKNGDPRTSTGVVVVGRAMIPVPEVLGKQGERRYELVSMCPWGKTIGGFIWVKMMLEAERPMVNIL